MIGKPLKEALKETLRVMLMAAIPVLVNGLSRGSVDYELVAVSAAIAGLRFVDKLLHEVGKERGDDSMSRGLTRF